ncbi:hypothetical protein AB0I84_23985 [Streptomyces spectabilis]|uniref:hypothetical protein n=1 Tax=Streptomyces spectabilis TaxID=68270 RepID=UPI00340AC655
MGIESDQLVFDYLSRVGDLAQQRQLPSGARMRLVSELRGEIERRRAKAADSPAAVRRILDRIGSPDDLVTAAAAPSADAGPERPRREVPRPRRAPEPPRPAPPHLAGTDELGDSAPDLEPDWWRVERVPEEGAHTLHGFVGGVEIPEMLRRPTADLEKKGPGEKGEGDEPEKGEATEDAEDTEATGDTKDTEDTEDGDGRGEEAAAPEAARRRRFGVLASLTKSAPPAPAEAPPPEAPARAAGAHAEIGRASGRERVSNKYIK